MNVTELNDLEFSDLLKDCILRLENENNHVTRIEIPFGDAIIFIDKDDEVSSQLPQPKRYGWFDFKMITMINKNIKL